METLLTAIAIIKQSRVFGDERCQALVTSLKDCLVSIQGNYGYRFVSSCFRTIGHLVVHIATKAEDQLVTNAPFSAGVAVVLGKTKGSGTGVATESVSVIENATGSGTEKILLLGTLQECLEDIDNAPAAGRGIRSAPENGKGTESTETDTADLVSLSSIYSPVLFWPTDRRIFFACLVGLLKYMKPSAETTAQI